MPKFPRLTAGTYYTSAYCYNLAHFPALIYEVAIKTEYDLNMGRLVEASHHLETIRKALPDIKGLKEAPEEEKVKVINLLGDIEKSLQEQDEDNAKTASAMLVDTLRLMTLNTVLRCEAQLKRR